MACPWAIVILTPNFRAQRSSLRTLVDHDGKSMNPASTLVAAGLYRCSSLLLLQPSRHRDGVDASSGFLLKAGTIDTSTFDLLGTALSDRRQLHSSLFSG